MEKQEILNQLKVLKEKYGEWTYDIPLPHNIWTKGNLQRPHTRLKRLLQLTKDMLGKPISESRILDLGSLDGQFSIEFALHGAKTVGIEIREDNINKALFCKKVLELENLEFIQDDVRNISVETYGRFDAIICSGLLYHLLAPDVLKVLRKMHNMCDRVVIIDTHIALRKIEKYTEGENEYWGYSYKEHDAVNSQAEKAKRLWASWDNNQSFLFTRPSLINAMTKTGFSSVYECFTPAHMNFGKSGIQFQNRCTFVAVKGEEIDSITSPSSNTLDEKFPEGSLTYSSDLNLKDSIVDISKKIIEKVKK